VAREVELQLLHHRAHAEHRAPPVRREGRRELQGRTRKAGREETEFIRSKDLWFRPIETRVGPDGALYVVDFYNQAVIHNDTRGPIHGPANAAVRPDRDHYFGRIWKVQHKKAKKPRCRTNYDRRSARESFGPGHRSAAFALTWAAAAFARWCMGIKRGPRRRSRIAAFISGRAKAMTRLVNAPYWTR